MPLRLLVGEAALASAPLRRGPVLREAFPAHEELEQIELELVLVNIHG